MCVCVCVCIYLYNFFFNIYIYIYIYIELITIRSDLLNKTLFILLDDFDECTISKFQQL